MRIPENLCMVLPKALKMSGINNLLTLIDYTVANAALGVQKVHPNLDVGLRECRRTVGLSTLPGSIRKEYKD